MVKSMYKAQIAEKKKLLPGDLLAEIIADEKSEILTKWLKRIKNLGGSYTQANTVELRELCEEFLGAFNEVLRDNSFLKLRIFIEKLSHIRSAQGFRLSEVQRAYYAFF